MAESIIPIRSWSSERWSDMPKVTGRFCSLQSQIIKGKGSGIRHACIPIPVLTVTTVWLALEAQGSPWSPLRHCCREHCLTCDPWHLHFCSFPDSSSEVTGFLGSHLNQNWIWWKYPAPSYLVWDNLETWVHWLLEFPQHQEALIVHSGNLLDNKHFIGLPSSSRFPISLLLPWDLLLKKSFALTALPLILRVCFWRTWTKTVTTDRSLNFSGTLSFLICKKRICILHTYLTGL